MLSRMRSIPYSPMPKTPRCRTRLKFVLEMVRTLLALSSSRDKHRFHHGMKLPPLSQAFHSLLALHGASLTLSSCQRRMNAAEEFRGVVVECHALAWHTSNTAHGDKTQCKIRVVNRSSTISYTYFTTTGCGDRRRRNFLPGARRRTPEIWVVRRSSVPFQTKLILGAPTRLPVRDTHPAVGGRSRLPSGLARYTPPPCGSSTYHRPSSRLNHK